MTRVGYDKLKADLDHMQNVEMPVLEERIGKARAEGDLSENAEYHGARESLQLLRARVNVLRDKLSRAVLVPLRCGIQEPLARGPPWCAFHAQEPGRRRRHR